MYRVLTVAREYECGGDRIAALLAERLGWKLIDGALIDEIAQLAHVDPQLVRRFDERVDSWVHRVGRRALTYGAFEGVAVLPETAIFDAETLALLAREAIEHAWQAGKCVIVGRGAQCILQERPDVFHLFLYAPLGSRAANARLQEARAADERRARYIQLNFGQEWRNPHLYDLMLNAQLGEERVVATILAGMGCST
jgi:cytidylate kinase